jgi:cyclase
MGECMASPKIQVDDTLAIYPGGGCNSVVLTSEDGKEVLIVDTKWFQSAKELRAVIKAPTITIINTHFHLDHARGNKLYPSASVISGETNWKQWDIDTGHSKRPDTALKPGEKINLQMDDETIVATAMGKAHSINDVVVYFKKRKLLAVGDLVFIDMHPVLLDTNSNVACWRRTLDTLETDFEIEKLVPGHGKTADRDSIADMRHYFSSIADAIGNPDELSKLRQVYKSYRTFPVLAGFKRTVSYLRKEMKSSLM